jgi:hypothetical protein
VRGIGTSRVFKARVAPLVATAHARYERRGQPVHIRTSFWHRAKSWPHARRSLVKVDVTAAGLNVRFMLTNRRGRATDLIAWYDDRGTSENWIKELKLDIHADALAAIVSAPTHSVCSSTASPSCSSPISVARCLRQPDWRRRRSGRSGSTC